MDSSVVGDWLTDTSGLVATDDVCVLSTMVEDCSDGDWKWSFAAKALPAATRKAAAVRAMVFILKLQIFSVRQTACLGRKALRSDSPDVGKPCGTFQSLSFFTWSKTPVVEIEPAVPRSQFSHDGSFIDATRMLKRADLHQSKLQPFVLWLARAAASP